MIDEQHRFGVKQRQQLLEKTDEQHLPHLLSMTATPIPRSLQLTVFGDLDVSTLDQLPRGRQEIKTQIILPNNRTAVVDRVNKTRRNQKRLVPRRYIKRLWRPILVGVWVFCMDVCQPRARKR